MAWDGSGNFNRVMNWTNDAAANIKIKADRHDTEDNNIASGISNCIAKDGQSSPTADIPMNGKRIVNIGAPVNPTDVCSKSYADALRSFNTAISLTGAVPEARIGFTQADIGFGARVAGTPAGSLNRFVWNDKPDLSGSDVAVMDDTGALSLSGTIFTYGNGSAGISQQYTATLVDHWKIAGANHFRWLKSSTGLFSGTSPLPLMTLDDTGSLQLNGSVKIAADPNFNIGVTGAIRALQAEGGASLAFDTAAGVKKWTVHGTGGLTTAGNLIAPNVTVTGNGFKPGGGVWADSSDARIKTVDSDYTTGLEAIKGLHPVRYTFKGNDTGEQPNNETITGAQAPEAKQAATVPYPNSPHYQAALDGTEFVGFIAQEVEAAMPRMVTQTTGYIDGVEVADLRALDTSELIFALVNACKEMAARIEALEARL